MKKRTYEDFDKARKVLKVVAEEPVVARKFYPIVPPAGKPR